MITRLDRTIIGIPPTLVAAVGLVSGLVDYLAGQVRVTLRHA